MILQILQNEKKSEEKIKVQVEEYMEGQNEAQEKEKIKNNIIIFNIPEATSENEQEMKREDLTKIKEVLNFVDPEAKANEIGDDKIIRLGRDKRKDGKPRPIKVLLENHEKKRILVSQTKKLKNFQKFPKVGISNDRTFKERNTIRTLKLKITELNKNGDKYFLDYRDLAIKEKTTPKRIIDNDGDDDQRPNGATPRGHAGQ